jgi:hypothetical protein
MAADEDVEKIADAAPSDVEKAGFAVVERPRSEVTPTGDTCQILRLGASFGP